MNIYGSVTTMSRRPAAQFENLVEVDLPTEMLQQAVNGQEFTRRRSRSSRAGTG